MTCKILRRLVRRGQRSGRVHSSSGRRGWGEDFTCSEGIAASLGLCRVCINYDASDGSRKKRTKVILLGGPEGISVYDCGHLMSTSDYSRSLSSAITLQRRSRDDSD